MNAEEKQKKLEALLSASGFDWEFIHPCNITEPILLIKNYAPSTEQPLVSFAFTLEKYYQGNSGGMGSKCWMTCSKVKKIEEQGPNQYSDYREFTHNGTKYFPFSVGLGEYTYEHIQSIRELCKNLYGHLDFSE